MPEMVITTGIVAITAIRFFYEWLFEWAGFNRSPFFAADSFCLHQFLLHGDRINTMSLIIETQLILFK
jgi:hypothetical protein